MSDEKRSANRKRLARQYLDRLQAAQVEPNFFCSAPYLTANEAWEITPDSTLWAVMEHTQRVFPPIRAGDGKLLPLTCLVDFEGYTSILLNPQFFDYEFIYKAERFRDLSGGAFKTFRKNVRRVEKRQPTYAAITSLQARQVFVEWASSKAVIDDLDTIWRYLEQAQETRLGGCWIGDELLGFNAWDQNWRFVNYRYCFALEPYVSEWLRWRFYRDWDPATLVNDGGSLGRPGLERFKRKLQPVEIRERWSWA